MNRWLSKGRLVVAFGFWVVAAGAFGQAQQVQEKYQPSSGQPGKDVVWVPTPQDLVDRMLDLAKVTPKDYVIDLGSGDGRTVITAAKRGAQALGIEYNPDLVALSIENAANQGVGDKASFVKADLFETDFSKATVITMFLLPGINMRLRPKLLDMTPGTRVVSNTFTMEDWQADDTARVEGCAERWCTAYLWIVPRKVEGKWRLPNGELAVSQSFQMISGTLTTGGKSLPITGRLAGDQIVFDDGETEYRGQVNGDTMSGIAESKWQATREK